MLEDLKKPFPPELISWRVGATTKNKDKGIPLAYIDARDVMERLDEVCGAGGWQNRYPMKGCCEIGIFIKGEWVWKTNGAGETQVEADKGQYSDAFKRAAVLWGIGRYLYDVENKWIEIIPAGRSHKIKNPDSDELKGMLAKAAKGIRVTNVIPDEPKPTQDEKLAKASAFATKAQTDILSLDNIDDLTTWQNDNKAWMSALEKYPALISGLNKAINAQYDRLG